MSVTLAGYKQTVVGVIPEDWNAEPLEKITTQIGDGLHGTPSYSANGGYFFVNGNNLSSGKVVLTIDTKNVDYSEFVKYRKPLSERSILLSINGTIGNLAFFDGEPIVLGKSAAFLNLRQDVCKYYIYQVLHTEMVRRQFFDGLTGSTISNLGLATIRNTQVPLPSTEAEQRAISNALSDVDALLAKLEQLIAKKRDLKKAAMQQLLTGQTRLPGFSGEWEVKRLGDVAKLVKGSGLSKAALNASGERKCILYGELFTTYGQVIEQIAGRTNSTEGQPSLAGDVLMPASTTTSGIDLATASALLEDDVALGGDINIIRPFDRSAVDSIFLANYLTNRMKREIAECTQGITIIHLYGRDLKDLLVSIPTQQEQTAIAAVLSGMDAELVAFEARRDKTRAIKQGMMQELLTGKIRLV